MLLSNTVSLSTIIIIIIITTVTINANYIINTVHEMVGGVYALEQS